MTDATNSTIDFFIVVALFIVYAFTTLLSGINKRVIKKTRELPSIKSNTELNKMRKKELVDLVLAYQS